MKHIPLALALSWLAAAAAAAAPQLGAYKDVTLAVDSEGPRLRSAVTGSATALPGPATAMLDSVSWAFAVGECGNETWSGLPADRLAAANVPAFVRAGQRYVLATGGEAGVFTCASDAGMERFIARHESALLAGVDFDIEGKQTDAQIDSLVQRAVAAAARRPKLSFSFTLATHAAGDGSRASLNGTGERVLDALRRHRFDTAIINLMVMDYGPASPAVCVVRESDRRCDMGRSGLQAARNVAQKYGVPLQRIALTAMIGVNDVVENVFTPDDARLLAREAAAAGLAGVHYWSLDRDVPCPATSAQSTCSSLPGGAALDFARAFAEGLGRR